MIMIKKYVKIRFDSYEHLRLNNTIEMYKMTIVVRVVFHENNKYYSQVLLDECLYKL